jgi:hypothetical protein
MCYLGNITEKKNYIYIYTHTRFEIIFCKLILICLFTLIPIKKTISIHHNVIFVDKQNFTKWNIIFLVEKWMPCDLLWAFNSLGSNMQ